MATVDIYLPIESTVKWIRALSIPHTEIQRFTFRPLKWLRFATFTVCGAKGHLSATQGGQVVDYENVLFENLADRYFYNLDDDTYHFVDHNVFNDEFTASAATPRQLSFFDKICTRDGNCAITRAKSMLCDAAHIIPRAKGNSYLSFVVRDRSSLYEQLPFSPEEDGDIDSTENGILLRVGIHRMFSLGDIAFLKTPNFAMEPGDVPRVEEGPIPCNRTTLQYMEVPTGCDPVLPRDIRAEVHPPPSILLDFMYGAAVVKRWKCSNLHGILEEQFKSGYSQILVEDPSSKYNAGRELDSSSNDSNSSSRRKSDAGLLEAMDDVLCLSMLLKGTTPQSIAAESEKQLKKKELHSQKHSCEKVLQWLKFWH